MHTRQFTVTCPEGRLGHTRASQPDVARSARDVAGQPPGLVESTAARPGELPAAPSQNHCTQQEAACNGLKGPGVAARASPSAGPCSAVAPHTDGLPELLSMRPNWEAQPMAAGMRGGTECPRVNLHGGREPGPAPHHGPGVDSSQTPGGYRSHLNPVTQWPNPAWFQEQRGHVLPWVPSPWPHPSRHGCALMGAGCRLPQTAQHGPRGPASTHTPGSHTGGLFKGGEHNRDLAATKAEQTAAQAPVLSHDTARRPGGALHRAADGTGSATSGGDRRFREGCAPFTATTVLPS